MKKAQNTPALPLWSILPTPSAFPFGKETTPREMKDQIIKLLDDWKGQQKEVTKPEKKSPEAEK